MRDVSNPIPHLDGQAIQAKPIQAARCRYSMSNPLRAPGFRNARGLCCVLLCTVTTLSPLFCIPTLTYLLCTIPTATPLLVPVQVIVADVADEWRDPGYWGTARMVLEAGLCLALDAEACAAAGCLQGGVLTPASAMGLVLIDRLKQAGLKFDITESPALTQQKQPAAAVSR